MKDPERVTEVRKSVCGGCGCNVILCTVLGLRVWGTLRRTHVNMKTPVVMRFSTGFFVRVLVNAVPIHAQIDQVPFYASCACPFLQ